MTTIDTKIHAIMQMALDCKTHDVFVSFAGHVQLLNVRIISKNTDYSLAHHSPLLDKNVWLNAEWFNTHEALDGVIDHIGALSEKSVL
jgi:hypothetical protein